MFPAHLTGYPAHAVDGHFEARARERVAHAQVAVSRYTGLSGRSGRAGAVARVSFRATGTALRY